MRRKRKPKKTGRPPSTDKAGFFRFFSLAAVMACGVLVSFLLSKPGAGEYVWKGYHTILVESEIRNTDYKAIAARIGALDIVSEATSMERISVINGFQSLPQADMENRLDAADPRFDDYLRKLEAYFHPEPGLSVFYAKTDIHPLLTWIALTEYFARSRTAFSIADYDPYEMLGLVITAILYTVLLIRLRKPDKDEGTIIAACSLPWIAVLAGGSPLDLASFMLVYPFFASFAISIRTVRVTLVSHAKKPGTVSAKVLLNFLALAGSVLVAAVICSLTGLEASQARLFCALFSGLSVCAILVITGPRINGEGATRKPGTEMKKAGITKADVKLVRTRRACILLFSLTAYAAMLFLHSAHPGIYKTRIASPDHSREKGAITLDSLSMLWKTKSESGIPDFSDYIAHSAFQEGFMYGTKYGFPGESVVEIPYFKKIDDGSRAITRKDITVFRFDGEWLSHVIDLVEGGSAARLLLDQGKAIGARLAPVGSLTKSTTGFFIGMFLHMFVAIAVFICFRFRMVKRPRS